MMHRLTSLLARASAGVLGHAQTKVWLGLVILIGLAPGAFAGTNRWAPVDSASDFGWRFEELFWLITKLCIGAFTIVVIMILIPAVRDRYKPGKKAHFDHGASLHDKRLATFISALTFIVLDAWVLVIAMGDLREAWWNIPESEEAGVYEVEVLAQQWAWNFRHKGADGKFGTADDILEMNDLTVPKDRSISIQGTSKDVIHSLFVPAMRFKKDFNPGDINSTWFKPITAGSYTILCAELCGYAHYQMFGECHVLESDTFDSWAAAASEMGVASFDPEDTEAQWAWDWKQ